MLDEAADAEEKERQKKVLDDNWTSLAVLSVASVFVLPFLTYFSAAGAVIIWSKVSECVEALHL